jgi:hypothetical protein
VNVKMGSLLGFYIFKGEWIIDDYIKHCNLKTCMKMQTKAWMMVFLFKEFFYFLKVQFQGHLSIKLKSYIFKWA